MILCGERRLIIDLLASTLYTLHRSQGRQFRLRPGTVRGCQIVGYCRTQSFREKTLVCWLFRHVPSVSYDHRTFYSVYFFGTEGKIVSGVYKKNASQLETNANSLTISISTPESDKVLSYKQ